MCHEQTVHHCGLLIQFVCLELDTNYILQYIAPFYHTV